MLAARSGRHRRPGACGCSSMAEHQLPKLTVRVRFPSPALPSERRTRPAEACMSTVDLNADLGEGFGRWTLGDDDALLDLVTSANVACGFHAGDPAIMRRVCERAVASDVAIGAQVGYRDLAGFGRRFVDVEPSELAADVIYQVAALDGLARVAGSRVRYVKPHGALYNALVHHEEQAAAVVEAVSAYDRTLPVMGLPGSAWLRLAGAAGPPLRGEGVARPGPPPPGT